MPESPRQRKVVHIDMDAFYASVEQRDDPRLRGRPVIVAWRGPRSVVCAASYEARRFGVHSAMSALRAARLCPRGVFVPPDFPRYRAVSRAVHGILAGHTDRVEPLSLDEAYLDVTENRRGLPSATAVAREIRREIRERTGLTASAGVAPNKFLAKIASDWNKPDGLFVIRPGEAESLLAPLPVERLPGVGRVTAARLNGLGIRIVGDLQVLGEVELVRRFGRHGRRLYELSVGLDDSEVIADRPTKSVSSEDTFDHDLPLSALAPHLERLARRTWDAAQRESRVAHTVVLKLKTSAFRVLTRSVTPPTPPASAVDVVREVTGLLARVGQDSRVRYRLAGVGLGNFREIGDRGFQRDLFAGGTTGPESGGDDGARATG